MDSNPLLERGCALVESYFRQFEARRLRRLRDERSRVQLRRELGAELEIEDDPLLDSLIELGITPDTAAAFEALPLVEVAWADGNVCGEERRCVLEVATTVGLELGRSARSQLELWLKHPPQKEVFEAWYALAASQRVAPEAAQRARRMLEGAHEVAAGAGGVLGSGAVWRRDRAAIARIRRALGVTPEPSEPS